MSTLKLGTQTGSVTNYLLSGTNGQPEPEVGMGCTFLMWTDREPGTIVSVKRFKSGARAGQVSEIGVRHDKAIRTDDNGMSEVQRYRFEPDPEAGVIICKRRKDGSFQSVKSGYRVRVGDRSKYHDYSF